MRNTLVLIALASGLTACATPGQQDIAPQQGLAAVHVPVVTKAQYVFDAPAPYGELAPSDAARLDGWFKGLELGYGDSIYVDGAAGDMRSNVARIAGNYGMLLSPGAPVTPGAIAPGTVRVIVSRNRAEVPNCPDWSESSSPSYSNRMFPNYGCAVNGDLAAMVANPEDLIHGREGSGIGDAMTSAKAVGSYYGAKPTGEKGLQDISTRKKDAN